MVNKILFSKRIKFHNADNTYMAPFVYDSKGNDFLHEPNINLSTSELAFKSEIISKLITALAKYNIEYISVNFRANMVKFKIGK